MNFNKLLAWHIGKFPKATFTSQLIHLAQEIKEYNQAKTSEEALEELADIIIVLISLRRFPETIDMSYDLLDFYYVNDTKEILKAIEKKIKIVDKRRYVWDGEDYDRERIY